MDIPKRYNQQQLMEHALEYQSQLVAADEAYAKAHQFIGTSPNAGTVRSLITRRKTDLRALIQEATELRTKLSTGESVLPFLEYNAKRSKLNIDLQKLEFNYGLALQDEEAKQQREQDHLQQAQAAVQANIPQRPGPTINYTSGSTRVRNSAVLDFLNRSYIERAWTQRGELASGLAQAALGPLGSVGASAIGFGIKALRTKRRDIRARKIRNAKIKKFGAARYARANALGYDLEAEEEAEKKKDERAARLFSMIPGVGGGESTEGGFVKTVADPSGKTGSYGSLFSFWNEGAYKAKYTAELLKVLKDVSPEGGNASKAGGVLGSIGNYFKTAAGVSLIQFAAKSSLAYLATSAGLVAITGAVSYGLGRYFGNKFFNTDEDNWLNKNVFNPVAKAYEDNLNKLPEGFQTYDDLSEIRKQKYKDMEASYSRRVASGELSEEQAQKYMEQYLYQLLILESELSKKVKKDTASRWSGVTGSWDESVTNEYDHLLGNHGPADNITPISKDAASRWSGVTGSWDDTTSSWSHLLGARNWGNINTKNKKQKQVSFSPLLISPKPEIDWIDDPLIPTKPREGTYYIPEEKPMDEKMDAVMDRFEAIINKAKGRDSEPRSQMVAPMQQYLGIYDTLVDELAKRGALDLTTVYGLG